MPALTLLFGLALAAPAFAGVHAIDSPLSDQLNTQQKHWVARQLSEDCSGGTYRIDDPVATFLTPQFYERCIAARGDDEASYSPFWRSVQPWEMTLRQALYRLSLSFAMSPDEIGEARAGRSSVLFEDVSEVPVEGGRKLRTDWLVNRGLFLVKDFLRAFDEEMKLPLNRQFVKNGRRDDRSVLRFKVAVDQRLLAHGIAVPVSAPSVNHTLLREWLRGIRAGGSDDPRLGEACDVLLEHLEPSV